LILTVASSANAPYNKSLDASGTSGLVIDNLSVTHLSPAASTQTLGIEESHIKYGSRNFD
jgi:hypothetical protein